VKLEKLFEDYAMRLTHPEAFAGAEKTVWNDLESKGHGTSDAAKSEGEKHAREAFTKHLVSEGWTMDAAENEFNVHWRRFIDPDSLRKSKKDIERKVQNVEKAAKWGWGHWLAFCLALGVGIHIITPKPEPMQGEIATRNLVADSEAQSARLITTDQFNLMVGGMLVPMAPNPALPAEPLPPAVAAVAEVPLAVEVTTPDNGTREYALTVEQVYRAAPRQGQRQIEQEAPKIEHDYNRPSSNGCSINDCLNQHRDEWNRHIAELNAQRNNQKDYSVTMGDGSSTIGIKH
jgi:hypothetical protein